MPNLTDFKVSSNKPSTEPNNIEIEDISKLGNDYNEYLIKIKKLQAQEILTITPIINIDKEYIEIERDKKYDFQLRDTLLLAGQRKVKT